MAQKRDYYEVLGVDRQAGDDEIKKAYRKLARQYHPDANPNDPSTADKFKEINEAYQVLSDPDKKARYDQFGMGGVDPNAAGGFDFGGGFNPFGEGGLGDLFDMFFSGGVRRGAPTGPQRGEDLRYNLDLDLREAVLGTERELEIPRVETCPECQGSGAKPGTSRVTCSQCHGSGQVESVSNTLFGRMVTRRPCPTCGGRGTIVKEPCQHCHGQGVVQNRWRTKFKVPAGVEDGSRLRVSGGGNAGANGGPYGDLLVFLSVRPDDVFTRQGLDLHCEQWVTFPEAALGGELTIKTIEDDTITVKVPAGTQHGDTLRAKGRGVPRVGGAGRGDLVAHIGVEVPTKLTSEQRDLIAKLGATMGHEAGAGGFFGRRHGRK